MPTLIAFEINVPEGVAFPLKVAPWKIIAPLVAVILLVPFIPL